MGFLLPSAEVTYIREHLERLGLENLREYVASDRWRNRRTAYYSSHPYRCRHCGKNERLNLHHQTYERLGDEPDSDLMPLCEVPCHVNEHLRWAREALRQTGKLPPVRRGFWGWIRFLFWD